MYLTHTVFLIVDTSSKRFLLIAYTPFVLYFYSLLIPNSNVFLQNNIGLFYSIIDGYVIFDFLAKLCLILSKIRPIYRPDYIDIENGR